MERKELHATGAAPILVLGTIDDPATPYEWSEALASQLDSGRLLTWEGTVHTAYRQGSTCVDEKVEDYLLTGACRPKEPPASSPRHAHGQPAFGSTPRSPYTRASSLRQNLAGPAARHLSSVGRAAHS